MLGRLTFVAGNSVLLHRTGSKVKYQGFAGDQIRLEQDLGMTSPRLIIQVSKIIPSGFA